MTSPDPQSTVPVEPLSEAEEDALRGVMRATFPNEDNRTEYIRRLLATLDAARASQPITATAEGEPDIAVLVSWLASAIDMTSLYEADDVRVTAHMLRLVRSALIRLDAERPATLREPIHDAIERIVENELTGLPTWRIGLTNRLTDAALAALPVREDEPTGIDVERLATALAYTVDDPDRLPSLHAAEVKAEYDRLTREASR